MVELIRRAAPDVIGTQELLQRQGDDLTVFRPHHDGTEFFTVDEAFDDDADLGLVAGEGDDSRFSIGDSRFLISVVGGVICSLRSYGL
ncbi:MAG: hypothetical protein L3K26_04320, partial [Candidatus Hydrogenedentes bacterium]|nr:hypothetical protein [Candidatus Hydrogenedentota bacterium]